MHSRLFILLPCIWLILLLPPKTSAIRHAPAISGRRLDTRAVLHISFEYLLRDRHAAGNLINRWFFISTAKSFPATHRKLKKQIRIGSMKAFEGGVLRTTNVEIPLHNSLKATEIDLVLVRITEPYDKDWEVGFLAVSRELRPQEIIDNDYNNVYPFVISGWHGPDSNWHNHFMNSLLSRTTGRYCGQMFKGAHAWLGETPTSMIAGCTAAIHCESNCASDEHAREWDDGTGVYSRSTNIMIGVVQSKLEVVPKFSSERNTIHAVLHHSRKQFQKEMNFFGDVDEFADFREFSLTRGVF